MTLKNIFDKSWQEILPYVYQSPLDILSNEKLPNISYQPNIIPGLNLTRNEIIFRVFQQSVSNINVVILGQDPYPRPGDATGYSFAKRPGRPEPVSLRNIKQEVRSSDIDNVNLSGDIDLSTWVEQGVFLLNTALTVETGRAGSHLQYWRPFMQKVVRFISKKNPTIWVLWGKKAQQMIPYISNGFMVKGYTKETIKKIPENPEYNYILTAPHPAAEASAAGKAGFFNCNHFYFINQILLKRQKQLIIW